MASDNLFFCRHQEIHSWQRVIGAAVLWIGPLLRSPVLSYPSKLDISLEYGF
jgi:hypothetical protein